MSIKSDKENRESHAEQLKIQEMERAAKVASLFDAVATSKKRVIKSTATPEAKKRMGEYKFNKELDAIDLMYDL